MRIIKCILFFILSLVLLCTPNFADAQTGKFRYSYDNANRQTNIITPASDVINTTLDNAGNRVTQTIINHCENDIVAPVITCPANITINCQDDQSPAATGTATATDDCSPSPIVTKNDVITPGNCAGNYIISRTWTATDGSGNSANCIQTNTVHDITVPVITCPSGISVFTDNGTCAAVINTVGTSTATDNCGTPAITNNSAGNSFLAGVTTVTWTATDGCGNTATCDQAITVTDIQPPVFSGCPSTIDTLIPSGNVQATISWIPPTAFDNCDGTISPGASHIPGSSFGVGTTSVTYTGTDSDGNSSSCSFNVIVSNSTIPVITCPANITINCGDNTSPANTGTATATTNCGTPSFTYSDAVVPGNCPGNYTISRTWIATGTCGNSASCIQTITVHDVTPPVITCPPNVLGSTGAGACTATVQLIPATATDNCGTTVITNNAPATFPVGVTHVVWTATDLCGNSITCTQTVTVNDVTPPNAVCQNITIPLNSSGTATISASQMNNGSSDPCGIASMSVSPGVFTCANIGPNAVVLTVTDVYGNSSTCNATVTITDNTAPTPICRNISVSLNASGTAAITAAQVNNGSTDVCGIQSVNVSPSSFTCANVGANTVTLTVTDVNGNVATCAGVVTITDVTAPTAVCQNISVNLNVGGTATITAAQINNGSSDACGIASMSVTPSSFNCTNLGPNTVTLTVIDVNGNSSTCTATVTVRDVTPPTALCKNVTVVLSAEGTASIIAAQVDNGSSDVCGAVTLAVSPSTFTCANVGANTVTLTVTDVSGNIATCNATVTVQDNTNPVALCKNITVQLSIAGTASIIAAQVDNGSSDPCGILSMTVSPNTFNCSNIGANTVTLTVTDNNGHTATCTSTVTVQDNVAPTAICKNISVTLNASGTATITAAQINNGSSDACGIASVTVSPNTFTCANVGANTVTLTVTDVNGNISTCTAVATVEDNVAPVAICQNITVQLDAAGTVSLSAAQIDNGSSDACGIDTMIVSVPSFSCANIGANNVTLTVTDVNGNSSTCVAVVTVQDTVDPVSVCQNISVQLNAGGSITITAAQVNNGSSDACGIAGMSVTPSSFNCANVGANTVTLTVTDNNGNQSTCTATVTVLDNNNPIALCQNITVQLDATGNISITPQQVDNGSGDQCGPVTLSVNPSSFTCANIGANTVTLTVTDQSGNTATCTATVTVQDTVNPVVICQNITVELDANGNVVITAAQVDNGTTDNCSTTSSGLTFNLSQTAFDCSNIGANTVTFTATDAYGNSSSCTATVNVSDTINPVVVCQDITVDLDANGNAVISALQVDNGSDDACGILSMVVAPSLFDCSNIGANTVTLTVTDNNGNASSCTATVTIEDNTNPTVVCQNITVQLDANGDAVITATDIDNGSTDNCSSGSGLTYTASQTAFDCSDIGPNTITLTVTDAYGNSSSCTAVVTVADTVAPVAICQNITVQLDANGQVVITALDIDNGSSDNCSTPATGLTFSASQTAFDCSDEGANNIILTVTDAYGNASTCTAVVTVENNVAPAIVCQDITVQLDASGNVSITAADVDGGSNAACGIATLTVSPSSFDCSDVGANTVTLTATDSSGNVSTCTAVVTVQDTINPTIVCQNVTITLDANGTVVINGIDVDNGTTDNCSTPGNGLVYTLSQSSFDCSDIGTNNVTLTVTDANGNSSSCAAIVTVTDTVSPFVICQNITVQLDANGNAVITAIQVDNGSTDNCSTPATGLTYAVSQTAFDCSDVGANTVTLTVTDAYGNSSSCNATVTITDDVDPVAICHDITIQLDVNGQATITAAQVNNGSSDNCGIASMVVNPSTFTCAGVGANLVTLTVTDVNGNVSNCSATVTIQDNVDPVAICQNISINLDANGNISIVPAQVNNGSSDACGIDTMTVTPDVFDCSNVGANTVTLTVTDVNGNVATCTSVVTVVDATDPNAICQNITAALDSNGVVSITAAQVDNGSNDACGIDTMILSVSSFDCSDIGDNQVTLTVTDLNGNSVECFSTVTIVDNIAPVALCQNITVELNAAGTVSINAAQINSGSSDACGIVSMIVSPSLFTCDNIGTNTVTLTVTDASGNVSICNGTVTIQDNVTPTVTCQDITINLDVNGTASITAAQINNNSNDACGVGSISVSPSTFTCGNVGANSVTLTVADINGNVSTCSALVNVADHIAPHAVCQNILIQLDENGNAQIIAEALDSGSTDICGIASMSVNQNSFGCEDLGQNTVTLTVEDINGNISICEAFVTVEDNSAPLLIIPHDTTICVMSSPGLEVTYEAPVAIDNCTSIISVEQIEGLPSGSFFPIGTTTNTFEAIDSSGNSVMESFRITINSEPVADFIVNNGCQGSPVFFQNTSTIGSGSIVEYHWDFGDGNTSAEENPSHLYETDGSYTIIFSITSDFGCFAKYIKNVFIYPAPIFTTEISDATCHGYNDGEIVVIVNNGSGPFSFSLNGGNEQQINTFFGVAAGDYSISARNSYNCLYIDTVTVNEPDTLNLIEITSTGVNCEGNIGGSIIVNASGGISPYEYYIDGSSTNHPSGTFLNETGGTHSISVTDNNECSFAETFEVPILLGLPTAGFTYTFNDLEVTFANTSINGTSYYWSFGDGPSATTENPLHNYPQHGNYNVTLIAYNECGSDTLIQTLDELTAIGEDTSNFYSITVFPNPNNGSFTLFLESIYNIDDLSVNLWTIEGKLIDKTMAVVGNKTFSKNYTYQLAPGLYILEISNKDIIHHEPVIIK